MTLELKASFLQEVNVPLLAEKGIRLLVKRDDLIHPYVSGNKWRKLKHNIKAFHESGSDVLVTMGGAYSNHIIATAAAGKAYGIKTIGLIRGEELTDDANAALRFAKKCCMELRFIPREAYRSLRSSQDVMSYLSNRKLFFLPEGGFNELAVKGCEEIVDEITVPFDYICCACGTGATLSGIIRKLQPQQKAIGFAVLHGEGFLEKEISVYAGGLSPQWSVNFDYHFGGYAKSTKELDDFCTAFSDQQQILIEPVYTGKLFFGIYDLIKKDFFKPGSTVVAVHTGGTAFIKNQPM